MDDVTLTYADRDLILASLFELTITYVEDDEKRQQCKAVARKLSATPRRCSSVPTALSATAPSPAREEVQSIDHASPERPVVHWASTPRAGGYPCCPWRKSPNP
jgi:hypothetical protein